MWTCGKRGRRNVEAPPVVGKTGGQAPTAEKGEKHPHAGGEDCTISPWGVRGVETPPRGWGRLKGNERAMLKKRNTPTRVGKTEAGQRVPAEYGKHPHAGGEDNPSPPALSETLETPPRGWGRHAPRTRPSSDQGNTPTRVGKTQVASWGRWLVGKHPHAGGEDKMQKSGKMGNAETPPRGWGRRTRH